MGAIIAVVNQKGGVGKTTTVANLAAALAHQGRRVLAVDFDPQGHLTLSLGVRPPAEALTVYELLLGDRSQAPRAVLPTSLAGLELVPSDSNLAGAEVELPALADRQARLAAWLRPLAAAYDFTLIDCPPSLSLLTLNAMVAADRLLVPLECSYLATQGLRELLDTHARVQQRLQPDLTILGILLTMYDGRTLHSREVGERVREAFGKLVFKTVIPSSVRFREAPVVGRSLLEYAPRHPGALAYLQLAQEVIRRESTAR